MSRGSEGGFPLFFPGILTIHREKNDLVTFVVIAGGMGIF